MSEGKTVEATNFVLVNEKGEKKAELGLDENGAPKLQLMSGQANVRFGLTIDESGSPRIGYFDGEGKSLAGLTFEQDGSTALFDSDGRLLAVLKYTTDGAPSLLLSDKKWKPRLVLGFQKGAPHVYMYDDEAQERFRFTATPEGMAQVSFANEKTKVPARLTMASDGSWLLVDARRKPIAKLTFGEDGAPSLELCDNDGKTIWKAP